MKKLLLMVSIIGIACNVNAGRDNRSKKSAVVSPRSAQHKSQGSKRVENTSYDKFLASLNGSSTVPNSPRKNNNENLVSKKSKKEEKQAGQLERVESPSMVATISGPVDNDFDAGQALTELQENEREQRAQLDAQRQEELRLEGVRQQRMMQGQVAPESSAIVASAPTCTAIIVHPTARYVELDAPMALSLENISPLSAQETAILKALQQCIQESVSRNASASQALLLLPSSSTAAVSANNVKKYSLATAATAAIGCALWYAYKKYKTPVEEASIAEDVAIVGAPIVVVSA